MSGFSTERVSDPQPPQLPPLGILDLMVFTAGMAVAFACRNLFEEISWGFRTNLLWFKVIHQTCMCLYFGLPLAAIYRFWLQKKSLGKFLLEPGHWIIASTLVVVVGQIACTLLFYRFREESFSSGPNCFIFVTVLMCICSGLLALGAWRFRSWWRILLLLMAIEHLVMAGQMLGYASIVGNIIAFGDDWFIEVLVWIDSAFNVIVSLGVLIVAIKECLKGPKRGLWHWLGLFLLLIGHIISPILNWIYSVYLFDPALFEN